MHNFFVKYLIPSKMQQNDVNLKCEADNQDKY